MTDVMQLGYIKPLDTVLDATYGEGRFWKETAPARLTTNDLDPNTMADHHDDFTKMPWVDGWFDVVVFDGPYKLNGTPNSGGPASSDASYGVGESTDWKMRMSLLRRGTRECARVASRMLLVKCQDQVVSGNVVWQTRVLTTAAESAGFKLVDMLFVYGYREQPAGRTQRHAGRDYSTLLVFQRRK
jgi:hypothetical protein